MLKAGWIFVLPFAVLVYELFWENQEAEVAALYASAAVLIIGLFIGYRGERIKPRQLLDSLIQTGQGSLEIMMIAAAAGFVMGILQTTGLGFALTLLLVKLGGSNLVVLLIIAGLMCIVLGMGMPTIGVYVLLAVLIAPSLVEVGFTPLASHMFILYLGMMSMVTPPVAIAAFFAASLAGAEPMRTGFTAMRFGWTAYIVPFLFIFSPSLLLQDPSVVNTAIAIITADRRRMADLGRHDRLPVPADALPVARRDWWWAASACSSPIRSAAWASWTDPGGRDHRHAPSWPMSARPQGAWPMARRRSPRA